MMIDWLAGTWCRVFLGQLVCGWPSLVSGHLVGQEVQAAPPSETQSLTNIVFSGITLGIISGLVVVAMVQTVQYG